MTRHSILDAAETVFSRQGVARTTLQDIACEAGVTRGAIYWYFEDKTVLYDAMLMQSTLPFESELALLDHSDDARPLAELRGVIHSSLRRIATDAHTQRVFTIAALKTELSDEMCYVAERRKRNTDNWIELVGRRIAAAKRLGIIEDLVDERMAARGLWSMVDGLVRTWMFDPASFDIVEQGQLIIETFLRGLQSQR